MKYSINHILPVLWKSGLCFLLLLCLTAGNLSAQEEAGTVAPVEKKPVRNTFESIWIMDNQTVMVPIKGTFEMDIQHRFGTVTKGYKDLWGIYAPIQYPHGVQLCPHF